MSHPNPTLDLTACDREPIHLSGAIQPNGYLIVAMLPDWNIAHVSANVASLFARSVDDLLGSPLRDLIGREVIHDFGNALNGSQGGVRVQRIYGVELIAGSHPFDVAIHHRDSRVFIELEARHTPRLALDQMAMVQTMVARVLESSSTAEFHSRIANQVRTLTFFDRVMVYRFLEDGSGEVVAEARRSDLEPFFGLRYPSTDIPAQARRLYLANWTRCIGDVGYDPIPIVPEMDVHGEALDLSHVGLRSVSPIHRQYLRNMGVAASMSISLICGGKLWGLIACHHYDPHWPDMEQRVLAELFGVLVSMQIEARDRGDEFEFEKRANAALDRIVTSVSHAPSLAAGLQAQAFEIQQLMACDSMALFVDGEWLWTGPELPEALKQPLVRFLNTASGTEVYATHQLSARLPAMAPMRASCAGMLAIPISRRPRDYILLFRREVRETVHWAGDPHKAIPSDERLPLSPRNSFATYIEEVDGQSPPWTDAQRRLAARLRSALLEVVLRYSEAAVEERRLAAERQNLLISELNHRVKNLLALIRSLVTRSRKNADSLDSFVANLQGRISALALAHDQITPDAGVNPDLRALVSAELNPYRQSGQGIDIQGLDVGLEPGAHTVLALVLHEMATNATKYGAFKAEHGRLCVSWNMNPDGDLELVWEEHGGPPVQAPEHEGFGSTLIRHTIPFELHGDTRIEYRLTGVRATFLIPARHVAALPEGQGRAQTKRPVVQENQDASASLPGSPRLMLLEDNMLIALDTEEMLQGLGAGSVDICNTVGKAMRTLEAGAITLAVLDVNLGRESSLPMADHLLQRRIPFIFATGYNDHIMIPDRFEHVPVVRKPVSRSKMLEALLYVMQVSPAGN